MLRPINEVFEILAKPLHPDDIEWRLGRKSKDRSKGEVLAYMNARGVMERLDEACGPENWEVSYETIDLGTMERETSSKVETIPLKGFLCRIIIKGLDGDNVVTIQRQDVSQCTSFEPIKGGASGAFKRAASQFGIGRYLYKLPATWVAIDNYGNFKKPILPDWALPEGYVPSESPAASEPEDDFNPFSDGPMWEENSIRKEDIDGAVINFGKYKGQKVSDIQDKGYLQWLANNAKDMNIRMAAEQAIA